MEVMRQVANQRFYCLDQPLLDVICCNRCTVISKHAICRPIAVTFVTWVRN